MTRIVAMRSRLSQELYALQDACPHNDKTGKYGSNTGNYDPSEDSYWYEINCKCCKKAWSEDQSNSKYKNNPNVEWIKRK